MSRIGRVRSWGRGTFGVVVVAAGALLLAGCSAGGGSTAVHGWRPDATCPTPAAVARDARASGLAFAEAAALEKSVAVTGCSYAAGTTSVSIATAQGAPSDVEYSTAAGIHNAAMPSLGTGAHTGEAQHFCGIAVPTASDATLEVTITTQGAVTANCSGLVPLVKLSAART